MPDDTHQTGKLLRAWQHGHLLGYHVLHAPPRKEGAHVLLERDPIAVYFVQHGDLLRPEVIGDLHRLATKDKVERVGERVGGVRAHDERALARFGEAQGGSG